MGLHIRAAWSALLLFAFWKVAYLNLQQVKLQCSSKSMTGCFFLSLYTTRPTFEYYPQVYFVLGVIWSETLKTGFLAMKPIWNKLQNLMYLPNVVGSYLLEKSIFILKMAIGEYMYLSYDITVIQWITSCHK